MTIKEKFDKLGIDNAPGQESLQKETALDLRGEKIPGAPVDFSHGDVDAHEPIPGSFEIFAAGVREELPRPTRRTAGGRKSCLMWQRACQTSWVQRSSRIRT